jgi:putative transposase
MKRPRRNHSAAFKAKVAVAALKGDRTLVELSEQFKVHPNQIGQWRAELLERAAEVFATAAEKREAGPESRRCTRRSASWRWRMIFWPARSSHRRCERKTMIDPTHELPIVRQAQLLEVSRSSVYYLPQTTPESELALMRRIDEMHLEYPFAGARMLRDLLRHEGYTIGRKRVATLMRRMDIEALYQKANTSRRHATHPVYPYLLRGLTIDTPNQVWAMDTTYIPMRRGFIYLTAVLDWATRRVLAWRLSNSLGADVAVAAVEEAIAKYGAPGIMNTDQGSQFTSGDFIAVLQRHAIAISMDGKGCWRDNVFVERLWKTIKYEHVYLHAYETVSEARAKLATYLEFYNRLRPHTALDRHTPDDMYFSSVPLLQAA